jgi:hypothetical protein
MSDEHKQESHMSSFGGKVLTGSVLAVIGLYTVKLVIWLVTGVISLFSFLLFTVLPIALGIWLIVKLFKYFTADKPAME